LKILVIIIFITDIILSFIMLLQKTKFFIIEMLEYRKDHHTEQDKSCIGVVKRRPPDRKQITFVLHTSLH
jgi:hypothetical protein